MSTADDGPRAGLRQLLPFLLEHRVTLAIVTGLSLLGAVATLTQPLLVGRVIGRVQAGDVRRGAPAVGDKPAYHADDREP